MRIPKSFKLLGQTITVEYDATIRNVEDCEGAASYRRNRIRLQPSADNWPLNDDQIQHTFLHELVHHITYYAGDFIRTVDGESHPHKNEKFVDMFAGLLHQALTTMEYEDGSFQ